VERFGYITAAAAILGLAILGFVAPAGALLPGMLFWAALAQGIVALLAAGVLTRTRWIRPLLPVLAGLHPLLLIFPAAFLVFARDLTLYPWASSPTPWLAPGFFVIRNGLMLLVVWLVAAAFSRALLRGSPRSAPLAVLYLFVFVITQSLIAFDWVMSFEYPWISTLFGGYFFVEALYAGIAVAAISAAFCCPRRGADGRGPYVLQDAATLLFGFSLLWAGQFFAQYLVIWYGNLPEEVAFLVERVAASPLRELSTLVLGLLFLVPFGVLLSRSAKRLPPLVAAMALLVLLGIIAERLVFLIPVMSISPLPAALGLLLPGAAYTALYLRLRRRQAD
jgi:hypothetical protein